MTSESNANGTSQIQNYYNGANVLITGGTGFLGKLILEKLLRTCTGIKTIFILIRPKRSKTLQDRFHQLLKNPVFDRLKKEQPHFADKIEIIPGDCYLPNLGIGEDDIIKLIDKVNCIFHSAATVRFDEMLRVAAYINVRATRDLLNLAERMKKLKSFVHFSTAYSNCVQKEVQEEVYDPPILAEQLLQIVENMNDELVESVTTKLIGAFPNTYTYTKVVAERLVLEARDRNLPVAIVRPSIVLATVQEPVAGWSDSISGASATSLGIASGLIRTLMVRANCCADIVPADYVVNFAISTAWEIGRTNTKCKEKFSTRPCSTSQEISVVTENEIGQPDVFIYNYVSSVQSPITWGEYTKLLGRYHHHVPRQISLPFFYVVPNAGYVQYAIWAFFLHTIPFLVIDAVELCMGNKLTFAKTNEKIKKLIELIAYFSTKEWKFHNGNVQSLWKKLNEEDRRLFYFDISNFDWDCYMRIFLIGSNKYLLKGKL